MPAPSPAAEPQDLARLAGLKLGNYRLERLIGRGRMGVVYLANDEALLRPTAIKLLAWKVADAQGQDPVRWFLAEARMVARINHPRVVQIYGAARQGDHCYIAMEYVVGRSAEALLEAGPLAPAVATDVLLQAAAALHAAHGSGVIHRDVKPANLLVGEGGVTKLSDFGMALGRAELSAGNAHLRVGTPYYTAPEIWSGGPATVASDLYSLGATWFHLLTGRPPFPGADVAAVQAGHQRAPVPDPRAFVPSLPASCAALVARALAKDPAERHASAQALLLEGRRVLQDLAAAGGEPFESLASSTVLGASPPDRPRPTAPEARRPAPPVPAALRERLGFAQPPFGELLPAGAPAAAARARILSREEIAAWVRERVDATLAPGRPPLVFSLDAILLLALRSEGAIERVSRIAENMLVLAAAEGRRTITSWHAWAASDRERWAEGWALDALPRRPEAWPPPEVVDVIDACRRGAGMRPWPRHAGRDR